MPIQKNNRAENLKLAFELQSAGKYEEANRKFCEAIDITPLHAYALILALKKLNITYYVAPYEADAQLAYLSRAGIADIIMTEDSDLLAFGAQKLFMKMDKDGNGILIDKNDMHKVEELNMQNFDHDLFLTVCIISGCDYLSSVKGIGFKKAFKFISESGGDIELALNRMRLKGLEVPENYIENFERAFLTFHFQVVY